MGGGQGAGMIRLATADDLDALCSIAQQFINESGHDVEYSGFAARQFFWTYIANPQMDVIVADESGIVGGAMVAASLEAQIKPFCYITKFYMAPEARRTGISRDLLNAVIDWAKEMTCSKIFSTATAGLDDREQALMVALLKRPGFIDQGPCMGLQLGDD